MNGEKGRGSELEFTGKVGILPHFRNSGIPFLSRLCNYAEVVRIASDGQNARSRDLGHGGCNTVYACGEKQGKMGHAFFRGHFRCKPS